MTRAVAKSHPRRRPSVAPLRSKTKLSLTLDSVAVNELQTRVGTRGLSAAVSAAVVAEADRLRRAEALDAWLVELADRDGAPNEKLVSRFQSLWQSDL